METENPCPYCKCEVSTDLWELDMRDGEVTEFNCGSCEMLVEIECTINVSYEIEECKQE